MDDIPEQDWREIEIVGWLYQFYIADRKAQIDARKSSVPKEDIPAKTQLFTPRWIVEYMVQNSLGRLWLEMYPDSPLRASMKYYIENPDDKDLRREPMKPEEIRCLDDACGSGHILVVMFDLLYAIYEERGYTPRDIPELILKHNLTGIDIDRRACQLASFAVTMKAREKDRRFFERKSEPRIIEIIESNGLDPEAPLGMARLEPALVSMAVATDDLFSGASAGQATAVKTKAAPVNHTAIALTALLDLFVDAKNYGSLLTVPDALVEQLPALRRAAEEWASTSDTFMAEFGARALALVCQAEALGMKYHAVVANPPYMGGRYFNLRLAKLVRKDFAEGHSDLYSAFALRNIQALIEGGCMAMITLPNWMFLGTFEDFRRGLLSRMNVCSLVHIGRGVWGPDFGSVAFTCTKGRGPARGLYKKLFVEHGEVNSNAELHRNFFDTSNFPFYAASSSDFEKIPGSPIAYWVPARFTEVFAEEPSLGRHCEARQGLATGDNGAFTRRWWEIAFHRIAFDCRSVADTTCRPARWYPYNKGGPFQKWYGNLTLVVDWEDNGRRVRAFCDGVGHQRSAVRNPEFYFRQGVTWSDVTSGKFSGRLLPSGCLFDGSGHSAFFASTTDLLCVLAFMNTSFCQMMTKVLNPTIHFQVGDFQNLPFPRKYLAKVAEIAREPVPLARSDWDNFETSWDFANLPILRSDIKQTTLESTWNVWVDSLRVNIARMQELETENNRLWIEAYGLQDELKPEVPEKEITLARPDVAKDMATFVSYAVGCMMGRYALDKPGLILADAGDTLNEYSAKLGKPFDEIAFPADRDAIIPILDEEYFDDDCAGRLIRFVRLTFGDDGLDENLRFLADGLTKRKTDETSRQMIRRYLSTQFFKDHCRTYKNRPIYWLFTSGPERAFQALVYVHRYRPDTIARMRTEYLHELQRKLNRERAHLEEESNGSGKSAAEAKMKLKTVNAQLRELKDYDEKLRHYAEQRIAIDLDDGVNVNYKKFYVKGREIVAPVQGVTNGKDEEE